MIKRKSEGQQFTEYMLLFACVTVAVFGFIINGPLKWSVEETLNLTFESLEGDRDRINSL